MHSYWRIFLNQMVPLDSFHIIFSRWTTTDLCSRWRLGTFVWNISFLNSGDVLSDNWIKSSIFSHRHLCICQLIFVKRTIFQLPIFFFLLCSAGHNFKPHSRTHACTPVAVMFCGVYCGFCKCFSAQKTLVSDMKYYVLK